VRSTIIMCAITVNTCKHNTSLVDQDLSKAILTCSSVYASRSLSVGFAMRTLLAWEKGPSLHDRFRRSGYSCSPASRARDSRHLHLASFTCFTSYAPCIPVGVVCNSNLLVIIFHVTRASSIEHQKSQSICLSARVRSLVRAFRWEPRYARVS
jgi:hypothetical protein